MSCVEEEQAIFQRRLSKSLLSCCLCPRKNLVGGEVFVVVDLRGPRPRETSIQDGGGSHSSFPKCGEQGRLADSSAGAERIAARRPHPKSAGGYARIAARVERVDETVADDPVDDRRGGGSWNSRIDLCREQS